MAVQKLGGEGPGDPTTVVLAKRSRQRRAAVALIRKRRRPLIAIGAPAQEPIQQTITPRVTMAHDPWKASVRCATTGNVNLATELAAGQVQDGVTLATGDRVLVRLQSDAKQNGIYVAPASGAASRADDGVDGAHYLHAVVGVQQGTLNGNHFFVCFTDAPLIIGSTSMTWADLGSFIVIDGSQISDGSITVAKLFGSGLSAGAMLYCDGSTWLVLEPPGAGDSVLHHDGTTPNWQSA